MPTFNDQQFSPWMASMTPNQFDPRLLGEAGMAPFALPPMSLPPDPNMMPVAPQDMAPAAQPLMKASTESRSRQTGPMVTSDSDYTALMNRMNDKELDSLRQQQLNIEDLKTRLAGVDKQDLPINLQPLAALTDAWTGSNFAQYAAPKDTAQTRSALKDRLQAQIMGAQQGISDQEIAMMKAQLGNQMRMDELAYKKSMDARQLDLDEQKLDVMRETAKGKLGVDPAEAFNLRYKLINTEPAKQVQGINGFLEGLNAYEDALDKYGISPTGEGAAILNTAYSQLSTKWKEAEKLGALAGPDLKLLNDNVIKAGGIEAWLSATTKGGEPAIKASIAQARKGAHSDYSKAYGQLKGLTGGVENVVAPVMNEYQSSFDAVSRKPTSAPAKTWTKEELEAEKARRKAGG